MTDLSTESKSTAEIRRPFWRKLLRWLFWLAFGFVLFSVVVVLIFRFAPAPSSGLMFERWLEHQIASKAYRARHQWVDDSAIAKAMPLAVIASEDQRFFAHFGFDFEQLEKALEANQRGKRLRGASTISQQTAKNLFLWSGRSYLRKGLEAWFTLLIELLWPKERILEMYLNIIEFGPGIYGVEAASRQYFGKPAKALTRAEAALLAAVLPNPHRLHAARPSAYVRERQQWILRQMNQLGSVEQLQRADP